MKNKKAFTLTELLFVVVIVGVLTAVAVPQYQKMIERTRAMNAYAIMESIREAVDNYRVGTQNPVIGDLREWLDIEYPVFKCNKDNYTQEEKYNGTCGQGFIYKATAYDADTYSISAERFGIGSQGFNGGNGYTLSYSIGSTLKPVPESYKKWTFYCGSQPFCKDLPAYR